MPDVYDLFSNGAAKAKSIALGNSLVITTSAGVLYGITGWCADSGTVYALTFDLAAVPSNGAISAGNWPDDCIQFTAPNTFSISIPPSGRYYKNGIVVLISTTAPPTLTIDTASNTMFCGIWAPIFGGGHP